jgi:hypothetical protein
MNIVRRPAREAQRCTACPHATFENTVHDKKFIVQKKCYISWRNRFVTKDHGLMVAGSTKFCLH